MLLGYKLSFFKVNTIRHVKTEINWSTARATRRAFLSTLKILLIIDKIGMGNGPLWPDCTTWLLTARVWYSNLIILKESYITRDYQTLQCANMLMLQYRIVKVDFKPHYFFGISSFIILIYKRLIWSYDNVIV